jgi:hypothetical protein
VVLFLPFIDDFCPAGQKSTRKRVKYLAAAGKSGVADATA